MKARKNHVAERHDGRKDTTRKEDKKEREKKRRKRRRIVWYMRSICVNISHQKR